MARAMARRWRCPPDNCVALWPTTVSMPCGRRAMWAARLAASSADCTRSRSMSWPSATLAATLWFSITTSCVTMAICERSAISGHWFSGMPSSSTLPLVGSTKRGRRLTSVVLPEPDGPTKATTSPGAMERLTPCRAGVSSSWGRVPASGLVLVSCRGVSLPASSGPEGAETPGSGSPCVGLAVLSPASAEAAPFATGLSPGRADACGT